jgi:hypothetical protein
VNLLNLIQLIRRISDSDYFKSPCIESPRSCSHLLGVLRNLQEEVSKPPAINQKNEILFLLEDIISSISLWD